jgi:hypothetical protein
MSERWNNTRKHDRGPVRVFYLLFALSLGLALIYALQLLG